MTNCAYTMTFVTITSHVAATEYFITVLDAVDAVVTCGFFLRLVTSDACQKNVYLFFFYIIVNTL